MAIAKNNTRLQIVVPLKLEMALNDLVEERKTTKTKFVRDLIEGAVVARYGLEKLRKENAR